MRRSIRCRSGSDLHLLEPALARTIFRGIEELAAWPLSACHGAISNSPSAATGDLRLCPTLTDESCTAGGTLDELIAKSAIDLLVDAARIRLRADVPVGAYLSGGLDSSMIAAIIRNHTSNRLDTFSIAFDDAQFDESIHQRRMAEFLGTDHQVVQATHADIGRVFPEVIWHTETPLMRTAPAPMFLLSKLVRDSGYKVVLTGEGADEFLAGYDIFKEAKVRRFWARQPDSTWRPLLFQRLYPDMVGLSSKSHADAGGVLP